jgi:hypothetical protein
VPCSPGERAKKKELKPEDTEKHKIETSGLFPVVVAIIDEAAVFAARFAGPANLPAVLYQIYVGFVVARARYRSSHYLMSLFIGALFRQQTQASRDPEDVNIYRKYRAIARE